MEQIDEKDYCMRKRAGNGMVPQCSVDDCYSTKNIKKTTQQQFA